MWHEARKQERLIRGMIVDYRRRAERRKDFYEKIKAEPTQFLQLHGRPCKIHLDPSVAAAGEGPAIMMPWQGDPNNMIDRFDVRAHLDYIPESKYPDIPPEDLDTEERHCNYERYRILAQNAFLGISEDKFLQQLAIEEQFGVTIEEKEAQKEKLNEKKGKGAAIGYNYNDPGSQPSSSNGPETKKVDTNKDSDDDSDLEIIDVDLSIDVNKMEAPQAHELNSFGPPFGMAGCDLFSFLTGDADDAEHQKQLLREEKEKAMFSGRKSRRERRAHRDKKLATRVVSPPSYAAPSTEPVKASSRSPSRSPTPETGEQIQFITSFGGEEDEAKPPPKPLYAEKLKQNLKKIESYSEVARKPKPRSSPSDDRSYRLKLSSHKHRSRSRSYSNPRSRSISRKRSPSIDRRRSRSISRRSRSLSLSKRRSRSISARRSPSISRRSRSNSSRRRSRSISRRSRSLSRKSYSRSRSRSRSRSESPRRRSRSPDRRKPDYGSGYSKQYDSRSISNESNNKGASKVSVPRYYGRRKEDKSSSEMSVDSSSESDDEKSKSSVGNMSSNQNQLRLTGCSSKGPSREALSLKEKLKRKMQAQLAKQLKADKRAEAERIEKESRRQARRDEEMRELAIKLRRKQREMRHQQNRRSSEDDSDKSRSGSSSRESSPSKKKVTKSKSKSRSPPRIPVWETNREPLSYRSKPEPEFPNHTRRRFESDDRPDDRDRRFERYDKFPKEPRYEKSENYDGRDYRNDSFQYRRRPYGHRGGYMGHGSRYDRNDGHSSRMDGPSSHSWNNKDFRDRRDNNDKDSPENSSRKIKLVDY